VTDKTRTPGQKINFPKLEIIKEKVIVTSEEKLDSLVNEKVTPITDSHTSAILVDKNGNTFVWVAQATLISMLCVAGVLLTLKADRKDTRENGVSRTSPSASISAQNHFIEEVAKVLEEPYA